MVVPLYVAVMVVVPGATAVARPPVGEVMVATAVLTNSRSRCGSGCGGAVLVSARGRELLGVSLRHKGVGRGDRDG